MKKSRRKFLLAAKRFGELQSIFCNERDIMS